MKIAIRTDASVNIGTGHVMRCLTLAHALRKHGAEVAFISREFPGNLIAKIRGAGFVVKALLAPAGDFRGDLEHSSWLGCSPELDARDTLAALGDEEFSWMLVDHYALDARWEEKARACAKNLMAIDDIADRPHSVDLLLDQNLYGNMGERYRGRVGGSTDCLLGPKYALLREEFAAARLKAKSRAGAIGNILVFYGGADPTGETLVAIEGLAAWSKAGAKVNVVVGPANPRASEIESVCRKHGFSYLRNVENISELMLQADLSLGAGGTTTWERCATGLPTLVTMIAKNQEEMSLAGARAGIQEVLGFAGSVTSSDIAGKLTELERNPELLRVISQKAFNLVDAAGTERVVGAMQKRV